MSDEPMVHPLGKCRFCYRALEPDDLVRTERDKLRTEVERLKDRLAGMRRLHEGASCDDDYSRGWMAAVSEMERRP